MHGGASIARRERALVCVCVYECAPNGHTQHIRIEFSIFFLCVSSSAALLVTTACDGIEWGSRESDEQCDERNAPA